MKYKLLLITLLIPVISFSQSPFSSFPQKTLEGKWNFSYKEFPKVIDFSNKIFPINSTFRGTLFKDSVNFSNSVFLKNAEFSDAEFLKNVNFDNTFFSQFVEFDVLLEGNVSFVNTTFQNGFDMYRLILSGNTSFEKSTFHKNTNIERVGFSKNVDFSNCEFDGRITFKDDNFNTIANFSKIRFTANTQLIFHNTSLPKIMDFSMNPKISNEINLLDTYSIQDTAQEYHNQSKSSKPCLLNLYNSDISKFRLDYRNFRLYFPKYYDDTNNVDSTEVSLYEKKIVYEALLNNFKIHGQMDSYQDLDIEYQNFIYDSSNSPFHKWLDHYWWNYGYNKEYIFWWTFGLLLFFTMVNLFFLNVLNNKIYSIESMPIHLSNVHSIKRFYDIKSNVYILSRRFWYSLVYTSAIFFKVSLKIENFKFSHVIGTIYLVMIYISGLICLAYTANFVIQK